MCKHKKKPVKLHHSFTGLINMCVCILKTNNLTRTVKKIWL